jgi:lysophospholipase L1-like esterase
MAKFKMITYVKDTWLILGITLFLLVFLEVTFSIVFLVRDHLIISDSRMLDRQSQPEDDRDPSWMNEYSKELEENSLRWEPYVYWRRKPYKGKYININADGIRLTTHPQASPDQAGRSLRVFMFGGSTMWGTNARDAFTIPSFLAKALQGRGMRVEISNFGETGYVSTQEVMLLLLQLRKGNVPDVIIFYDGVNDTYSAYQNGIAGIPQNEMNRVKEFNLLKPERHQDLQETFVRDTLNNLSTVRFVKRLSLALNIRKEVKSIPERSILGNEEQLAKEIVNTYLGNVAIVKSLAASYGFKPLFYWQPTIFEKNKLSDYEKNVYGGQDEQDIQAFYKATYGIMRKNERLLNDNTFHDVSTIFLDVRESIFVDWFHLRERGNDRIAQAMVGDIVPLLESHGDAVEPDAASAVDFATLHLHR